MDYSYFHIRTEIAIKSAFDQIGRARYNLILMESQIGETDFIFTKLKKSFPMCIMLYEMCQKMIDAYTILDTMCKQLYNKPLYQQFSSGLKIMELSPREMKLQISKLTNCNISQYDIPSKEEVCKGAVSKWPDRHTTFSPQIYFFIPSFLWGRIDQKCTQCRSEVKKTILMSCCNTEQSMCDICHGNNKINCRNQITVCYGTVHNIKKLQKDDKQFAIFKTIIQRYIQQYKDQIPMTFFIQGESHPTGDGRRITKFADNNVLRTIIGSALTNIKASAFANNRSASESIQNNDILRTVFDKVWSMGFNGDFENRFNGDS
jgi:hypothetical protein